jgi:hypothetical protein
MSGKEHAERILAARREESEQRQWQIRKGEILKSGIPVYWSRLCDYLKTSANDFNSSLGLTGDSAIQVYPCETYVMLTKKSSPVFLRKVSLFPGTERVRVTTEIVLGLHQPNSTTEEYLFDVRLDGTIELDRKDFCTFAKDVFADAAALFR